MSKSFQQIIDEQFLPLLRYFSGRILEEGEVLAVDGVKVFKVNDCYVPGKVVNAASLLAVQSTGAEYRLESVKKVILFTAGMNITTWSSLNYLAGLYRLQEKGLLAKVLSPAITAALKLKLDWREFVDPVNLELIKKPTNYYGVAFGIARYRRLLGWEDGGYENKFFQKLMDHIDRYSGSLGYMDETAGEGRFDRYSLMIPAELCGLLVNTGKEVPEKLRLLLRKAAEIFLRLANHRGDGFSYGRSIGVYGDTAIIETFSIAARLGILNPEEQSLAYAYSVKALEKLASFWIDPEMKSINIWEKGRNTDNYRNKNRILDVNLTVSLQLIGSCEHWGQVALEPPTPDLQKLLENLPKYSYFSFYKGDLERGLAIIRDGSHVFTLPLINGGKEKYLKTPYFPIPNQPRLLETAPETEHPQLIPRLKLSDGSILMPLAYFKKINTSTANGAFLLSYEQDYLCLLGEQQPRPYQGIKSRICYRWAPGCIEREEWLYPSGSFQVEEITLEFANFAESAEVIGVNRVAFKGNQLEEFSITGLPEISLVGVAGDTFYRSSHGHLKTKVLCQQRQFTFTEPLKISWVIKYKRN